MKMEEQHKLIQEMESLPSNKEKVERFFELRLGPKYGMSAQFTIYMYQLYQESSGDNSMAGKFACGSCQDQIYRRLQDFIKYGDNIGKPLNNWEPTISQEIIGEPVKIKRKKK